MPQEFIPPADAPVSSPIPHGEYCYRVISDPGHEPEGPYEVWFHRPAIAVRCPYWRRTDHATVCCDFLRVEHADEDESGYHDIIETYFGGKEEASKRVGHSLLYDEIKICGVNTDED